MKGFEELYNEFNNDSELYQVGEGVLKQTKRRTIIAVILCIVVTIILLLIIGDYAVDPENILDVIIFLFVINAFIYFGILLMNSKERKRFLPIFKEKIIKKMIDNFFNDMEYFPNQIMQQSFYKEAQYNENYNVFSADDYIVAKLDSKYSINMAEVRTINENNKNDGRLSCAFSWIVCKNLHRKKHPCKFKNNFRYFSV